MWHQEPQISFSAESVTPGERSIFLPATIQQPLSRLNHSVLHILLAPLMSVSHLVLSVCFTGLCFFFPLNFSNTVLFLSLSLPSLGLCISFTVG